MPSWSRSLVPRAEASTEARHLVSDVAAERVPAQVRDDAILLTSELVANALRHGVPAGEDQSIELMITAEADTLRVAVSDAGPGFDPSHVRSTATGGWGLPLVDQLASRWGVERMDDRTEVWFELDADSR